MEQKLKPKGKSIILKASAITLSMALVSGMLAACSKGDSGSDTKRSVLRIGFMYSNSDNEPYLRQQFTDSYELTHPNVDIEIAAAINYDDQRFQQQDENTKQPDPYEKLKEMLAGSNPVDVVVLDSSYLKRLVQDNMLTQLDPLIADSKFDIEDFVPAVIDGIKDAGDNNIYALTPTFSASALYYNKGLFTEAGLTPPTDNMQWPDIFNLAERISKGEGKKRTFGFSFNRWSGDGFYDTQNYASPLQLTTFDKKGEKMTVDTPQWNKVWSDVAKLYKNKIVPTQEDMNVDNGDAAAGSKSAKQIYNPFQGDLFINGRVAMTIGGYDYINELARAKDFSTKNKDIKAIDWDVVTVPTFAEAPGVGGNIYLNNLMAINSKAQNSEDAWEFIQFNNSKEWAKLKSRSSYEMVARKSFLKPKDGMSYNIGAFYALKPTPPQDIDFDKLNREKPNLWSVNQLGQPLFQEVLSGKKSVDAALKEWQTKGDAFLQKLKQNPNATLEPVNGGGVMGGTYGG
ncbi:ABC transporter substrate-binding protein [Paenibacillus nasutitermitis]|uniref:Sugar ABC transporter substrate-binding protein n=1 Tax=Paenibacillus nasutitermitis TaxID=1652958 RepID=A0A916Z1X9_9BACL|nr:extracellular solute-binding protein [Paenibacillus nasutitermitis]GGD70677.1 sugar ABC transporter substrate-binding protein [Paenibacillus nasutitermitis]